MTIHEFSFGPQSAHFSVANRMDLAGVKNHYRFNLSEDDEKYSGVYLQNDQFADGVEILDAIFDVDYVPDDMAVIETIYINQSMFVYF